MAKVFYCNDLVPGCRFEARGNSAEEILAEIADHIATVCDMVNIRTKYCLRFVRQFTMTFASAHAL